MRLSDRRTLQTRLSRGTRLQKSDSETSLIYSYATARSLVASYKTLIKRCRTHGFEEEFSLPSALAIYENNNNEPRDERGIRFAAARRRQRREKYKILGRGLLNRKSLRDITRTVVNEDFCTKLTVLDDKMNLKLPADPLNLLKVKSVQPIVDDDRDSLSSGNSCNAIFSPRTISRPPSFRGVDYQRYKRSGYRKFGENSAENRSSTGFSSDSDSFEGFSNSSSSCGSESTVEWNDKRPNLSSTNMRTKNIVDEAEAEESVAPVVSKNLRNVVRCPICDKICANLRGLHVHLRTHRSVKCQICEVPTITKKKFTDHILLHVDTAEPQVMFQCPVCKNFFKTDVGLKEHMRIHSKSVPAVKLCTHCNKTFATTRGFQIHMVESHYEFKTE